MTSPRILPRLVPPSLILPSISSPSTLSLLNTGHGRRIASSAARAHLGVPVVSDFWQWLSEKGAVSAAVVKPAPVPEGLGLVAQKDIARNEVVVEVPKGLWIDPDKVAASEIGRLCADLKPWVGIALFLLREKALGPASYWQPYLDILPSATNSTIFWSEEEISEIQDEITCSDGSQ